MEAVSGEAIPEAPKEHTDEDILKEFNNEDVEMRNDEHEVKDEEAEKGNNEANHIEISVPVPVDGAKCTKEPATKLTVDPKHSTNIVTAPVDVAYASQLSNVILLPRISETLEK